MKLDGKEIAKSIYADLTTRTSKLKEQGITPELAIVLIGEDPASVAYVGQKEKHAEAIGAHATIHQFPKTATNEQIQNLITDLNTDPTVHGIIIQRPTPESITFNLNEAVLPQKDVDGFHPKSPYEPPIALAVWEILKHTFSLLPPFARKETLEAWVKFQQVVVIGKGEAGGKPIIDFLRKRNIDPEVIDSKTKNSHEVARLADILIPSVGKEEIVTQAMIKPGAVVIGVGMYRGEDNKLHADYELEQIKDIAGFYTPVPGGVGPVNVATLLSNLIKVCESELIPN